MSSSVGLLARLEAKSGKEKELAEFLKLAAPVRPGQLRYVYHSLTPPGTALMVATVM